MKELTIEEKARRYDEALERARKEYKNHEAFKGYCEMLEHIFTELKEKESKDEKIRKELINYFIKGKEYLSLCSFSKDEILAYLEKQGKQKPITIDIDKMVSKYSHTKDGDFGLPVNCQIRAYRQGINDALNLSLGIKKQGEQKPTDKVEPKFKVGDWIVTNKNHIWYVDENPETTSYLYRLINQYGKVEVAEFEVVDNVARLWTIQDAKDGDVLYDRNNACLFRKKMEDDDAIWVDTYCGINSDGMFNVNDEDECWCLECDCVPATKEQRDLLFQKMKEAGYEWDAEKKELKKQDIVKIPFGAKDSELQEASYHIPKGFHVEIDGNKVVIKKGNQKPAWSKEDEEIYQSIIDNTVQENQLDNKQINWLKSLKSQKLCVYNPYKAVVESIAKMCDKYKNYMGDEKEAKDFLANVAVKCREAAEYDKNYSQ